MYARARMTSDAVNSTHRRVTSDDLAERACVRAGVSPATPECLPPSQARAGANDFDSRHAQPGHPREGATAAPEFLTASARANESGLCRAIRAGAHANKSGSLPVGVNQGRVICGAKRRRDGQPCQGLRFPASCAVSGMAGPLQARRQMRGARGRWRICGSIVAEMCSRLERIVGPALRKRDWKT